MIIEPTTDTVQLKEQRDVNIEDGQNIGPEAGCPPVTSVTTVCQWCQHNTGA